VYDIKPERVRLDSTTASSYCGVNTEGLFQWGHSPDFSQRNKKKGSKTAKMYM
jgi:hypothetical protein